MIEPLLSDDDFLANVRATRGYPGLHLWWLGQSGFLLHYEGRFALLDPYLSDSLTTKYANTNKPHVRMTRRVVDPAKLNFVHVVTSSHNHTDHLDPETIKPLLAANPKLKLIVPEANREFVAQRLQVALNMPEGLEDGMSVKAGGFEFHGVPAAHDQRELDDQGRDRFMGYVIRAGPWTVYYSGDTVPFIDLDERVRDAAGGAVDVAILPINGKVGNMSGREAASVARDIGAKLVIPCHYEMFEFNTASPDEFIAECKRLGQPYKLLRAGERWGIQ
jgi:L-ascorbate metabolism protein UlaG (beta-lactamase superfamily)